MSLGFCQTGNPRFSFIIYCYSTDLPDDENLLLKIGRFSEYSSLHNYYHDKDESFAHLHICSDWLITRKTIAWTTLMKFCTWVVVGTSITHQVCCRYLIPYLHRYSDWRERERERERENYSEVCLSYSDET